jgi:hypothetical protein
VPVPFGELAGCVLPDTVNGLPLHALSVHATVVLVPLLALLGVLYAVPLTRAWARWPLALLAIGASAATFVSMQSGEVLEESGGQGAVGLGGALAEAVERHEELADQLQWIVYAYAVIALVAVLVVRAGDGAGTGEGDRSRRNRAESSLGRGAVAVVTSVVLIVGAAAVAVQTYRVGDAGAKAVWNPDGKTDYSAD